MKKNSCLEIFLHLFKKALSFNNRNTWNQVKIPFQKEESFSSFSIPLPFYFHGGRESGFWVKQGLKQEQEYSAILSKNLFSGPKLKRKLRWRERKLKIEKY
jgi:hypothetical protein